MLAKWSLGILTCIVCIGWLFDHAMLTEELNDAIEKRSLADCRIILVDFRNLLLFDELQNWKDVVSQDCPSFLIVFKILKSWELWQATGQERYVAFASTALGVLECDTAIGFCEQRLMISKHVKLDFQTQEMESLNRFVELALNYEH